MMKGRLLPAVRVVVALGVAFYVGRSTAPPDRVLEDETYIQPIERGIAVWTIRAGRALRARVYSLRSEIPHAHADERRWIQETAYEATASPESGAPP